MKNKFASIAITVVSLLSLFLASSSFAQTTGISRTELQRHDLSTPGREAIQVAVEFEQGAAFGMHTHPGEEIIYVLEGIFTYEVEGQAPVTLKAGEVLFIPAGKAHAAINTGNGKAIELATYIVEKDRPLLTLVPDKKEDN